MNTVRLFSDKTECCGCGACLNACPVDAISMREDAEGFCYPQIDADRCIACGACRKACGYQKQPERHAVRRVYAAAAKSDTQLKQSASGGAFAVLAERCLAEGGFVYGASMEYEDGKLCPKHIKITDCKDLKKLQGSKYVQSDIGLCYRLAEKDLKAGKQVLFSGTPCQIAGLKSFLKKEYDNLLLVEVICHGVPSQSFFRDYVAYTEVKRKTPKTTGFLFRDKSKGQSYVSRFLYQDGTTFAVHGRKTSFISLFLDTMIFRSSCYSCPYAAAERTADITLGDFWGFHEEYPSYDKRRGLSDDTGISCVLVNTEKGERAFTASSDSLVLMESDFETVARHNDQLHRPSKLCAEREKILTLYREHGYEAVETYYRRHFRAQRLKYAVSGSLPKGLKRSIKKMMGRIRKR